MDTLFGSQCLNFPFMDFAKSRRESLLSVTISWADQQTQDGGAAFRCAASMADAAINTTCHLHKRRRLSQLLDKLTIQVQNNNQYPPQQWPMLTPRFQKPSEASDEAPLDLSLKKEIKTEEEYKQPHVCGTCGQMFSVHDRLAKHVASRHRNKTPEAMRAYECDVCNRKFARSDMLTRHARLHSGIKPYSCSSCGQVFSRSDHLVTHQRTHTGEKPYRCPSCPYAACRRDMITRHMRTHTRKLDTA